MYKMHQVVDLSLLLWLLFDGQTWALDENRPVRDKFVPYVTADLESTQQFSIFCFCANLPNPEPCYKTTQHAKIFST